MHFKKVMVIVLISLVVGSSCTSSLPPLAIHPGALIRAVEGQKTLGMPSTNPQVETLLFDGFESGTANWTVNGSWSLVDAGGNNVLEGTGGGWATLNDGQHWTDYTFTARVKRDEGRYT